MKIQLLSDLHIEFEQYVYTTTFITAQIIK